MRAREFIIETETKLRKASRFALPHAKHLTGLDQYYGYYRLGVAMAGSPDETAPEKGPAQDNPTIYPYSSADEEIASHALKSQKVTGKDIVKKGKSEELPNTNTVSPVAQWNKKS